jgi:hypothetical protein
METIQIKSVINKGLNNRMRCNQLQENKKKSAGNSNLWSG